MLRCTRARLGRSFLPGVRGCLSALVKSIGSASLSICMISICISHIPLCIVPIAQRSCQDIGGPRLVAPSLHFCATYATLYARWNKLGMIGYRRDVAQEYCSGYLVL